MTVSSRAPASLATVILAGGCTLITPLAPPAPYERIELLPGTLSLHQNKVTIQIALPPSFAPLVADHRRGAITGITLYVIPKEEPDDTAKAIYQGQSSWRALQVSQAEGAGDAYTFSLQNLPPGSYSIGAKAFVGTENVVKGDYVSSRTNDTPFNRYVTVEPGGTLTYEPDGTRRRVDLMFEWKETPAPNGGSWGLGEAGGSGAVATGGSAAAGIRFVPGAPNLTDGEDYVP